MPENSVFAFTHTYSRLAASLLYNALQANGGDHVRTNIYLVTCLCHALIYSMFPQFRVGVGLVFVFGAVHRSRFLHLSLSMRSSVVLVRQIIAQFSRNRSNCDTSMKPGTFIHFIALSFRASMRGSVVSVVRQIIAKFYRNRSNCDTSMKPGTFTLQIALFKKSTGATQNSKMVAPKSKMSAKTLCHTYLQHNIILCTACFTFVHFMTLQTQYSFAAFARPAPLLSHVGVIFREHFGA